MGKGDKKSKKGKIWRGSYGNSRKRAGNKKVAVAVAKPAKAEKVEVEAVAKPKAKPRKKAAPKKKAKPADE